MVGRPVRCPSIPAGRLQFGRSELRPGLAGRALGAAHELAGSAQAARHPAPPSEHPGSGDLRHALGDVQLRRHRRVGSSAAARGTGTARLPLAPNPAAFPAPQRADPDFDVDLRPRAYPGANPAKYGSPSPGGRYHRPQPAIVVTGMDRSPERTKATAKRLATCHSKGPQK